VSILLQKYILHACNYDNRAATSCSYRSHFILLKSFLIVNSNFKSIEGPHQIIWLKTNDYWPNSEEVCQHQLNRKHPKRLSIAEACNIQAHGSEHGLWYPFDLCGTPSPQPSLSTSLFLNISTVKLQDIEVCIVRSLSNHHHMI